MIPPLRLTAADREHLAHAADRVLQHRLIQVAPWRCTEGLLSVARQDPGLDQGDAQRLVYAALVACITAEILVARHAGAEAEAAPGRGVAP